MSDLQQLDEDSWPKWLQEARENAPKPVPKEELEARARRDRFAEVGPLRTRLPDFLRAARMNSLARRINSKALLGAAVSWAPERGNLLLLGDTGEGKTTAAGLLVLNVIKQGVTHGGYWWQLAQGMSWIRAEELERAMRNHPMGRGEAPDYNKALGAKLLVLDEIGWEKDHKLIASVLAARYDSRNLTVVTSGQTVDELRQTYGDAIVRRIITYRGRPGMMATAFQADQAQTHRVDPVGTSRNPKPPTEVD